MFAARADRDKRHLGDHQLTERASTVSIVCSAAPFYGLEPGHFGRSFGSMNSPPKRSRNCSACARSAKQKTSMSVSSRRKECVRGHSERASQKRRMVT